MFNTLLCVRTCVSIPLGFAPKPGCNCKSVNLRTGIGLSIWIEQWRNGMIAGREDANMLDVAKEVAPGPWQARMRREPATGVTSAYETSDVLAICKAHLLWQNTLDRIQQAVVDAEPTRACLVQDGPCQWRFEKLCFPRKYLLKSMGGLCAVASKWARRLIVESEPLPGFCKDSREDIDDAALRSAVDSGNLKTIRHILVQRLALALSVGISMWCGLFVILDGFGCNMKLHHVAYPIEDIRYCIGRLFPDTGKVRGAYVDASCARSCFMRT